MTDKNHMSIQRAAALIDNLPGKFHDEDDLIQILIDMLKTEQILDVAISIENWRQRRAIDERQIIERIARDMALLDDEGLEDLETELKLLDNGDGNDTKH